MRPWWPGVRSGSGPLDGFKGIVTTTDGDVVIQSCWIENDVGSWFSGVQHGDDVGVYRSSIDALIWFNEVTA